MSKHFTSILHGLARPEAYPEPPASVEVVETHISAVFLAGERAYKVKKPVALPFLDFSTLTAREHFCHEEVRLNAALAPGVYLGVVPVLRSDGHLVVGHDGEAADRGELVDWAVSMRRLPSARMLDALLDRGSIDNDMLRRLAATLARFHANAARGDDVVRFGTPAAVQDKVEANFQETDRFVRSRTVHALSADVHDLVEAWALHFLREHAELFAQRARDGHVREGHGDLHAGNICFGTPDEGGLVIYDRIEFSPAFRCGDVAEDLAFLLMDLDHRGFRGFSDFLAREAMARTSDHGLLEVIDFYKCYRAWVRGKVAALRAKQSEGEAREAARLEALSLFNLGAGYAVPPSLVILCGLPGTGKTHVASHIAAALDCVSVNSDHVRKGLVGVAPSVHRPAAFGAGLYSQERSAQTYDALLAAAEDGLARGRSVVVDAGFRQRAQRAPFLALAHARRAPVVVLHLDPPAEVVRSRLQERSARGDSASDADVSIYEACRTTFEPPVAAEAPRVVHETTLRAPQETAAEVLACLLRAVESSADPGEA
ncbi:MAG: AAA family ATPase [Planctomycetota bacterium]